MRLKDLHNSVRRLLFENAMKGFEYSGRGTCFICRHRERDFVVTAKHLVEGFPPDSIRVSFYQGSRAFLPYRAQLTIKKEDSEAIDWADLAIFPLDRTLYTDEDFAGQCPYPLVKSWHTGLSGGRFSVRGFPNDVSYVDYERKALREQAAIAETARISPSPVKHCYELSFREGDLSHFATLDGFSGSPVFWISDTEPHAQCFAGVAIRGGHSVGKLHFVHASVLLAALETEFVATT